MNKSRRSQSEAKIEIVPEAAQIIKATHTPSSFAKPLFSPHQETILSLAEQRAVDILVCCSEFTPIARVPSGSKVILVVDDEDFVRFSTQQSFYIHSKQITKNYIVSRLAKCGATQIEKLEQYAKQVLSPSIYLVEASSGLESIYFFELLNKANCQILLILLDINMGPKEIDGYETASRIREHEKQI